MHKNFDYWNDLKKEIDKTEIVPEKFPKEREVWMSSLGQNIGYEQNGSGNNFIRPVLVIKKFNNQMFWIVPLTTKQKEFDFYFNYADPNNQEVSAILAQIRLVSVKRFNRKMYEISNEIYIKIKENIKSFL
jgi:mRNA interferase MazF